MAVGTQSVADVCRAAKEASRRMAVLDTGTKDRALHAIADSIDARAGEILEANRRDVEAASDDLSAAFKDKMRLDAARVAAMADGVRAIVALRDPVGEVIEGFSLPNGLDVRKVRVPLGVVAVIYEARPNVTIDCTALAIKSGNAIVLRGSSQVARSNAVLAAIATEAATAAGLPEGAIGLVAGGGHGELAELATQDDLVDLIVPRGGEGLKKALTDVATVPVIYAASGNCHVYVDAGADLDEAEAIVMNAKTQRPGVCNAAETLLVHRDVAGEFLPRVLSSLREAGVELRADGRAKAASGELADSLLDATSEDWDTEFLAMILAVGVVDSVEEAIAHVNVHGSGHSEAIVTSSVDSAHAFEQGVDAACVYVNASTRFTDGFEFGMGAEIANSTQKLHARGPIGMRELCTYKYVIEGAGQTRP
jgi:glutamate-5-semialdehyde dehydrogenase